MDDRQTAPELRDDLIGVDDLLERPLPIYEPDPEVRSVVEREHYDEQILAALVFP